MNEGIMRAIGFGEAVDLIAQNKCPICKNEIKKGEFKDELSRKEFKISGMCQSCQDKIFTAPDEDPIDNGPPE